MNDTGKYVYTVAVQVQGEAGNYHTWVYTGIDAACDKFDALVESYRTNDRSCEVVVLSKVAEGDTVEQGAVLLNSIEARHVYRGE